MKNKILIIFAVIICLLVSLTFYYHMTLYKTITLGIFSGSNWDVPNPYSYTIIDKAINRFEKENPYIHIEYQSGILKEDYSTWLSSLLLKGNEPDLYMVLSEDFNTFSSLQALENLDPWIKEDHSFSIDKYYSSSLQAGTYHEIQYALPYESNPTLMFVNQTLLEKEGIPIPEDDWTIDDFYSICNQVTKDTNNDGIIDQFGYYNYTWQNIANAYNVQLFNDNGTNCYFNQENMKEALQYIKKLSSLNRDKTLSSQDFDQGHVAFYPLTFSDYRTYKPYPYRVQKYSTFKWKCIAMPRVKNIDGISENSTLLLAMSSRSSTKKEAWEFLKYLTYNEHTQTDLFAYSQGISVLKNVTQSQNIISLIEEDSQDNTVNINTLNKVMEQNVSLSKFKKKDAAILRADSLINQALAQNDDIDTALNRIQKDIHSYLNE